MTEKKWKKYCAGVARRLNLPKEVKMRVMSDFESAIEARQEAGLTDDQILAELGSPKKAAADLNAQMQEFASRKSPWRILWYLLFGGCALYGGLELLGSLAAWLLYLSYSDPVRSLGESAAIGVIGGADGPTAVFVTAPGWMHYINPVLLLCIGIAGFLWLKKRK